MVVTVDDLFLDIIFDDLSVISDIKRLNMLIGGKTLYIVSGDYRSKRKGEARFWVPVKYKDHFINYLKENCLAVVKELSEGATV